MECRSARSSQSGKHLASPDPDVHTYVYDFSPYFWRLLSALGIFIFTPPPNLSIPHFSLCAIFTRSRRSRSVSHAIVALSSKLNSAKLSSAQRLRFLFFVPFFSLEVQKQSGECLRGPTDTVALHAPPPSQSLRPVWSSIPHPTKPHLRRSISHFEPLARRITREESSH